MLKGLTLEALPLNGVVKLNVAVKVLTDAEADAVPSVFGVILPGLPRCQLNS